MEKYLEKKPWHTSTTKHEVKLKDLDTWEYLEAQGVYEAIRAAGFDVVKGKESKQDTYVIFSNDSVSPVLSDYKHDLKVMLSDKIDEIVKSKEKDSNTSDIHISYQLSLCSSEIEKYKAAIEDVISDEIIEKTKGIYSYYKESGSIVEPIQILKSVVNKLDDENNWAKLNLSTNNEKLNLVSARHFKQ